MLFLYALLAYIIMCLINFCCVRLYHKQLKKLHANYPFYNKEYYEYTLKKEDIKHFLTLPLCAPIGCSIMYMQAVLEIQEHPLTRFYNKLCDKLTTLD